MDEISFSSQSMFAELVQRSLDCEFDGAFQENRSFVRHCRTPVVNCYHRCDAGSGPVAVQQRLPKCGAAH